MEPRGSIFVFMLCLTTLEMAEESYVVLGEETQILDAVFEVGDTLHTHTECVAAIDL